MFLLSSCICLCPIYWSHVLSCEWRCSWSSADRRCSNYIWVINNLIACKGASYRFCGMLGYGQELNRNTSHINLIGANVVTHYTDAKQHGIYIIVIYFQPRLTDTPKFRQSNIFIRWCDFLPFQFFIIWNAVLYGYNFCYSMLSTTPW